MLKNSKRYYKLPLSELIDKLTITQLRELLLKENRESNGRELLMLEKDIDLSLKESNMKIDARIIRMLVLIGQLNVLIWMYKDMLQMFPDKYDFYLKLAHQINGLKNQLKNKVSDTGKTNINTDGLDFFVSVI